MRAAKVAYVAAFGIMQKPMKILSFVISPFPPLVTKAESIFISIAIEKTIKLYGIVGPSTFLSINTAPTVANKKT